MQKNQTAREFYHAHKEKIEQWLDLALYTPDRNVFDGIPNKININNSREFRRFCLVHEHLQILKLADLSRSQKVLDIGAGFGDFSILADAFDFEKIDATDPGVCQYNFITEKFNYYNNVYNLPLEVINMSEYDTVILLGIWVSNWAETLKNHILINKNLKDVVIVATLLHNEQQLFLDAADHEPAPWKYDRPGNRKLISFKMMNLIFKSHGFQLENSFARKNDAENHMTSKYYLHYQRS